MCKLKEEKAWGRRGSSSICFCSVVFTCTPAAVLRLVSDGVAAPAFVPHWGREAESSCGRPRSAVAGCLTPFGRTCTQKHERSDWQPRVFKRQNDRAVPWSGAVFMFDLWKV